MIRDDWKWSEEQCFTAARMAEQGFTVETIALKVRKSEHQVRRKLDWHGSKVRKGRPIRLPDRVFKLLECEAERRGYDCEVFAVRLLELTVKENLVNAVLG